MTVTIGLVEVLLFFLLVVVSVGVAALVLLLRRLQRASGTMEARAERVADLVPQAERLFKKAEGELDELHAVTEITRDIAVDVKDVSAELRTGVTALRLARRSQAVVAGVKAGIDTLKHSGANGSG